MIYLTMFLAGLLGILLYCLEKGIAINKAHKEYGPKEVFNEFVKAEWLTTLTSLFCICVLIFLSTEYLRLKQVDDLAPDIKGFWGIVLVRLSFFIKTLFVILGYLGQRLVYKWLGRTEQKLSDRIDRT